ncbi:glycosyl transferase, partial [Vibrio sp. V1B]
MSDLLWTAGFVLSALLIIYHHVGYPLVLNWLSAHRRTSKVSSKRGEGNYKASKSDSTLPSITVIVPAYNEEQWIAEKIRNLASLDYPRNKLT